MKRNYGESAKINRNPNWLYISNHSYRILIIDGSGSGKNNVLLNLAKTQQSDIDKYFLYVKYPFQSKYQLLNNGREKVGIKKLKHRKTFIDYSQTADNVCENLEEHNLTK